MSTLPSAPDALALFAQCLKTVPDPRSKQGTSHPCSTLLAVVLLGLLAKVSTPAEIARWTKRHFSKLSKVLRFGRIKGELKSPCDNTITRVLKKHSLADLQNAFADFINALLQDTSIVGSPARIPLRLSVPSERQSAEDSGKDESVLQRCGTSGTERCDALQKRGFQNLAVCG